MNSLGYRTPGFLVALMLQQHLFRLAKSTAIAQMQRDMYVYSELKLSIHR